MSKSQPCRRHVVWLPLSGSGGPGRPMVRSRACQHRCQYVQRCAAGAVMGSVKKPRHTSICWRREVVLVSVMSIWRERGHTMGPIRRVVGDDLRGQPMNAGQFFEKKAIRTVEKHRILQSSPAKRRADVGVGSQWPDVGFRLSPSFPPFCRTPGASESFSLVSHTLCQAEIFPQQRQ